MKCIIIINPSSGRKTIQANLDQLIGKLVLDKVISTTNVFYTKGRNDAYEFLLKINPKEYDLIIAVGGDGTQNEVINGIIDANLEIPLYIIAAGTVNDLANVLKIPTTKQGIINSIKEFNLIEMDLGKANERYFTNVIAGGMFSDIGFRVDKKQKAILGPLAYYINAILDLPNQLNTNMRLTINCDNEVIEEDVLLFMITNSKLIGGFMLASAADISDGLLDLLIIKKCEITDLLALSKDILLNKHLESPYVIYRQAKKILINSNDNIILDVDGEKGEHLPIDVVNVHKAIKIIAPPNKKTS